MSSFLIKILGPFIIFFAITPNLGFFNTASLSLLILVSITFYYISFRNKLPFEKIQHEPLVVATIFILLTYGSLYYGGLYQEMIAVEAGKIIQVFTVVFLFYYYYIHSSSGNKIFIFSLIMYLVLSILTITTSPHPIIDAFVQMKEAPLQLLQGNNPYDITFTKIYQNVNPTYFTFLPMSFVLSIPSVLLLGDPRYLIIGFNLLAAFALFSMFKKSHKSQIGALAVAGFLFLPRSFYMLEHMFLDQIVLALYILFCFIFVLRKERLLLLILALFFSFKQHLIILMPLFAENTRIKHLIISRNIVFFIAPFMLPLYFLVLNPQAFLNDTLFSLTASQNTSPIYMSLSISTFLRNLGFSVDTSGYLVVSLLLTLLLLFALIRRKNLGLALKITLTLFTFHLLLHHSFFNHYFLIAGFLYVDILNELLGKKYIDGEN